ncbi:hypothetical protein BJ508DRAFT_310066 [Ascobolus immersus RN42]|uniref:F-box domain-containing protein n=1 Tax=Ascobolus immersus RN42 TaxID=1160509 RepID=A0A3N4HV92_ASCIM|nr:hypothetical protein BJ508DRAFT_310066 [Ascobolus immersus RN42]
MENNGYLMHFQSARRNQEFNNHLICCSRKKSGLSPDYRLTTGHLTYATCVMNRYEMQSASYVNSSSSLNYQRPLSKNIPNLPNELLHAIFVLVDDAFTFLSFSLVNHRFYAISTREAARLEFAQRWFASHPLIIAEEDLPPPHTGSTLHAHYISPDIGSQMEFIVRYTRRHFQKRPFVCTSCPFWAPTTLRTKSCLVPNMAHLLDQQKGVRKESRRYNVARGYGYRRHYENVEMVPFMGWDKKWARGYLRKLEKSRINEGTSHPEFGVVPMEELRMDVEDVVLAMQLHDAYAQMVDESRVERGKYDSVRRGFHEFWEVREQTLWEESPWIKEIMDRFGKEVWLRTLQYYNRTNFHHRCSCTGVTTP